MCTSVEQTSHVRGAVIATSVLAAAVIVVLGILAILVDRQVIQLHPLTITNLLTIAAGGGALFLSISLILHYCCKPQEEIPSNTDTGGHNGGNGGRTGAPGGSHEKSSFDIKPGDKRNRLTE